MENLKEELHLPKLGGKIIAYRQKRFNPEDKISYDDFDWGVRFFIHGPDRRYNIADIWIYKSDVPRFANLLENALKTVTALQNQSFSGSYTKSFSVPFCSVRIEAASKSGKALVTLWVSSSTQTFGIHLTVQEVSIVISKLRSLDQKGQQMVEALKSLTQ